LAEGCIKQIGTYNEIVSKEKINSHLTPLTTTNTAHSHQNWDRKKDKRA
jgi:hypothetical protein